MVTKKVNITIEFWIFELVAEAKEFPFGRPNLPKKDAYSLKHVKWTPALN